MHKFFFFFSSLFFYLLSCFFWIYYDPFITFYQYYYSIYIFDTYYTFVIDSISLFFIYLTSFLSVLCLIFCWNTKINASFYYIGFLISIELLLFFVFTVCDLFLFYIFFEAILIPFFIYIGICGYKKRRIHAAYLFFFYTLVGSLLMLLSIIIIYLKIGSTDLLILNDCFFSSLRQHFIWITFFLSFGIKMPIFPFHLWLPEAHVEAPTEGSVLLAGILLKLGAYGFFRFVFVLFPEVTFFYSPVVLTICSMGILYSSLTALRQIDIKKIIAYSSIAHMNMAILGLFTFNYYAIIGCFYMMVGHGIVSASLFFLIGILYDRLKTKLLFYYSGLVQCMPIYCFFFFFFTLCNTSFPGTVNFISELLLIIGIASSNNYFLLFFFGCGVFIGTIYSIWIFTKSMYGIPYYNFYKKVELLRDLSFNEFLIVFFLMLHALWYGIFPQIILDCLELSMLNITFDFI